MENIVVTVISESEGCELLLKFYNIWFSSRNIKDILSEDKHLTLPSFKKCLNNHAALAEQLAKEDVFDFIKEELECEEVILQIGKIKVLIKPKDQEEIQHEEDDDEEDDDDEWVEDEDEDE
jgi:hypothetical protein